MMAMDVGTTAMAAGIIAVGSGALIGVGSAVVGSKHVGRNALVAALVGGIGAFAVEYVGEQRAAATKTVAGAPKPAFPPKTVA